MPESPGNIEEIQNSLKASLGQGRSDLDQDVVAGSKRVLLQSIAFQPASAPYAMQRDALRAKYISLNPAPTEGKGWVSEEMSHQQAVKPVSPSPSGSEKNGDTLPVPRVVLYPEEKVKMEWTRMTRIGAGLVNMGNTCFFNSTLQCLTYTAPLVNYCFTNDHREKCTKKDFCMMCEIQSHIKSSLDCGGRSIKPHSILQKLRCIAKHMKWGRQEDAHEFLRFVVDHLQQACLNGETKLDRFSKETTVINQIFGGYLRSQVTCLRCQAKSNTFDPFMDLSLDIKGVNTVEDALAKYVKPETLDQDNAYKCPKCKNKVRAQKRFSIQKAPNVLTLQLNRFDFHRHLSGKLTRFIKYPEKINLRNYMSQRQGDPVNYHLYGVLVHSGHSSEHGHYYSYVKSPSKTWYCMNDSIVHQASYNSVLSADAYVLFYARINKGSSSNGPSTPSHSLNHVKAPSSPLKNPFIGPTLPNHIKQESSPMVNGIHGKPTSELGSPIKRQQSTVVSPAHLRTNGSKIVSHTSTASALPEVHNKISFPILTSQQKKQQQQPKDDGKRIVLQIKHGNSTTMEKSPDGKSKVVNGGLNKDKFAGLVPYNDDTDSEQENQATPGQSTWHTSSKLNVPTNGQVSVSKTSQSAGDFHHNKSSTSQVSFPSARGDGDAKDIHRSKSNPGNQTGIAHSSGNPGTGMVHSSVVSRDRSVVSRDSGQSSKTHQHSSVSTSNSGTLSHGHNLVSKAKQSSDPHHHQSPRHGASQSTDSPRPGFSSLPLPSASSLAAASAGKASVVPLDLPVVNVSSSAECNTAKVKATGGNWLVQTQDGAGFPSPRGSSSSTNSVNSTTEWTVQSKDSRAGSKPSYPKVSETQLEYSARKELHVGTRTEASPAAKSGLPAVVRTCESAPKDKTTIDSIHGGSSREGASKCKDSQSVKMLKVSSGDGGSPGHSRSRPSHFSERERSLTPVDISDKRALLQSPSSSSNNDTGQRKSKKHKKRHKKEAESWDYKELREESASRSDSSSKKKKKHKHKKERLEKKKHKQKDYSSSDTDSDSQGPDKHKRHKHHRYESSSSESEEEDRRKRKKKKFEEDEDQDEYEWVEKTIETSERAKKVNPRASVQTWNQHVKDDVAPRKEMHSDKVKATWDGSRKNKVITTLEGSSYSFGNQVLSWDGYKNHNDREVEREEKMQRKRHWSDEYNQEIDSGKVKKMKKPTEDRSFSSHNPFQSYQSERIKEQSGDSRPSWSQDHSYHQHYDHHYHKKTSSSSQNHRTNHFHSKHNGSHLKPYKSHNSAYSY